MLEPLRGVRRKGARESLQKHGEALKIKRSIQEYQRAKGQQPWRSRERRRKRRHEEAGDDEGSNDGDGGRNGAERKADRRKEAGRLASIP